MPADSFVGIWKFVARPNLCETPACVKPPERYMKCGGDSAIQRKSVIFVANFKRKNRA
jgi:hypothetical protein